MTEETKPSFGELLTSFPGLPPADTSGLGVSPIDLKKAFSDNPAPLDFVLPGLLSGTVGVIVSPGGTGKSMLMLESAIAIGIGEDFLSLWGQTPYRGRVVYVAAEDPREVIERRLHALGSHMGSEKMDLAAEKVEVLPMYGQGFKIAEIAPKTGAITASNDWLALVKYLEVNPTRLLILDTFNRLLGGISENDSGAMGAVLSIVEQACRKIGCAIILVHHTNKASMNGGAADQQAARGSSAITDNARWQVNLSTMDKETAALRGIEDDGERRQFVRLDLAKVNYGPPISERWLKRGPYGELMEGEPPAKIGKENKPSRKSRRDIDDDAIPY